MLKWLKNDEEFYRTVPKAVLRPNQRRTFHIDGVKVDIENSKVMSKTISRSFCNVVKKMKFNVIARIYIIIATIKFKIHMVHHAINP